MSTEGVSREPGLVWEELLDSYGPPHREDDWVAPAMWPLVQAAMLDPVLRSKYPWTSTNQLHVSSSDDWEDFGSETFPGIAAWSGGYSLVAHPWGEGRIVLETTAPGEAVAFLAAVVREQMPDRGTE